MTITWVKNEYEGSEYLVIDVTNHDTITIHRSRPNFRVYSSWHNKSLSFSDLYSAKLEGERLVREIDEWNGNKIKLPSPC